MAQTNNNQSVETIYFCSFSVAQGYTNCKCTSKAIEVSYWQYLNGDNTVRACYQVQSLNSKLLPLSTEFEIKVKGQTCILKEEDNVEIMFNSKMIIVAFDNLSHWAFNGREGLNATGVRRSAKCLPKS